VAPVGYGSVVPALDLASARARFAALGSGVAYLDGPGGSQVPDTVIEAMVSCLRDANANLDGAFGTSVAATRIVDDARLAAADLVGGSPTEIAFGPNMSTLNFLFAHAVARTLEPGDEIVTTALDHDANISPWLRVAEDHGLYVRQVPIIDPDLGIDVDALEAALSSRTRVVAFTLASNAVGTIPPARRIADLAHAAGALAWADAVHFAPHRRIDVRALGVDVLLCSPYKFFGPHLGIAWARRQLLEAWPADRVRPAAEDPPGHRFELGTQSHEALAGLTAVVDYLASLGSGLDRRSRLDNAFAKIQEHEESLARHFLIGLGSVRGATLHGIADPESVGKRTPTFCVTLPGRTPRAAAEELARRGINAWDGNYYAPELMMHLGLEGHGGAVRIGFLHYTSPEEVGRVLTELRHLVA
jgi:cysteine desulfurase family protein (TIGR01976 family)